MGKWTDEARRMKPFIQKGVQSLEDADALEIKTVYFEWEELLDESHEYHTVSKGFKFRHGDKLYKTEQPEYTFTDVYAPGSVGTESLFSVIDETHAGTIGDPVPAVRGMEYTYGLYYADPEDGNTYMCERTDEAAGGKIVLHYLPHELIGQYFTMVE